MDNDTLNKIKAAMGYRDGTQCCKACKNFVPTDCSGALNAKNAHCTLSPAIEVPVDESGFCKYFAAKVMANDKAQATPTRPAASTQNHE